MERPLIDKIVSWSKKISLKEQAFIKTFRFLKRFYNLFNYNLFYNIFSYCLSLVLFSDSHEKNLTKLYLFFWFQIKDENGKNITNPYHESAKIKFKQISVLENDNNGQIDDNNVENNSYLGKLSDVYKRVTTLINERRAACGTFDVMCLLTHSKEVTPTFSAEHVQPPKTSGFIDIDNNLDAGELALSRSVRSVKSKKTTKHMSLHNDDEDFMGDEASGEIEGSGEIHEYSKTKHTEGPQVHLHTSTEASAVPSPGQPRKLSLVCWNL